MPVRGADPGADRGGRSDHGRRERRQDPDPGRDGAVPGSKLPAADRGDDRAPAPGSLSRPPRLDTSRAGEAGADRGGRRRHDRATRDCSPSMTDRRHEPVTSMPVGGWLPHATLTAPLPASTDVVIVGGGLAGCLPCLLPGAARDRAVLLERGELNREASGTNAGSFHFQIALHQLTAMETRQHQGPAADRGPPPCRGGRGLEHARTRARRPPRHPHHRRTDGRRDRRGTPTPARQAA